MVARELLRAWWKVLTVWTPPHRQKNLSRLERENENFRRKNGRCVQLGTVSVLLLTTTMVASGTCKKCWIRYTQQLPCLLQALRITPSEVSLCTRLGSVVKHSQEQLVTVPMGPEGSLRCPHPVCLFFCTLFRKFIHKEILLTPKVLQALDLVIFLLVSALPIISFHVILDCREFPPCQGR